MYFVLNNVKLPGSYTYDSHDNVRAVLECDLVDLHEAAAGSTIKAIQDLCDEQAKILALGYDSIYDAHAALCDIYNAFGLSFDQAEVCKKLEALTCI